MKSTARLSVGGSPTRYAYTASCTSDTWTAESIMHMKAYYEPVVQIMKRMKEPELSNDEYNE
jgi:hypothetical protein